MENKCEKCGCPHHLMMGIVMILASITFLLGAFEVLSGQVVNIVWPVLLGLAGVFKLGDAKCKCCAKKE